MADLYVSASGSATAPYDTWARAANDIATAYNAASDGDRIFVDYTFVQTSSVNLNINFPVGTEGTPISMISADPASGEPPSTLTAGAEFNTSNSSAILCAGDAYVRGVSFYPAKSISANADLTLGVSTSPCKMTFEDCYFEMPNGSTADLFLSTSTASAPSNLSFKNCTIKFSNAGSQCETYCRVFMEGCSLDSSGAATTSLFFPRSDRAMATLEAVGCDFSQMSSSGAIVDYGPSGGRGTTKFVGCKFPSGFTGNFVASSQRTCRDSMYECMFGTVRQMLWIADFAGSIKEDTGIYRSGGASDGNDPISWKIESNGNCSEYVSPLYTDWIAVPVFATGSKTFTAHVVLDSATALQDDEIWLEVDYLGTSSSRETTRANDKRASITTAPTDQASSSETWVGTGGFANVTKQQLSVTATLAEAGIAYVRIGLGIQSTTVYACPKIEVT